jgi:hypothetical protein
LCYCAIALDSGGGMNATQTLHLKKIGSVPDAPLETDLRAHLGWIVGDRGTRHVPRKPTWKKPDKAAT